MYPVVIARSGSRTEHAANIEVMPAAVPSIVFSIKGEKKKLRCSGTFLQIKEESHH